MSILGMVAGGALGGALGIAGQKAGEKERRESQQRQFKQDEKMQERAHMMQYDMWNKTNAEAQMAHLKNAGLNAGLMYGGSGAGGATAGAGVMAGAGTGSGQNADLGMGIQMANVVAQNELMKAQAQKTQAETKKIGEETKTAGAIAQTWTPETIDAMIEEKIASSNSERERAKQLRLANDFEEWMQKETDTGQGMMQSQKQRNTIAEINKTLGTIHNLNSDTELKELLKGIGQVDLSLKRQQFDQLDKENKIKLEKYETELKQQKAELERYGKDPENTETGMYTRFIIDNLSDVIQSIMTVKGKSINTTTEHSERQTRSKGVTTKTESTTVKQRQR